mgnify:CR=1 FL=1
MSFLKEFAITFACYIVFNLIFMVLFVAVGGLGPEVTVNVFFGEWVANDWGAFLTVVFQPGGNQGSFYLSILYYANPITTSADNGLTTGANVMGIIWVVMPGVISALIGGYKYSEGEIARAYFSTLFAIVLAYTVPIIISSAGLLDPALPNNFIAESGIIPDMFLNQVYIKFILVSFINGAIFGGPAAVIAESNY